MPLDVLVFASPNPGKEQRVAEILTFLTEKVRAEESYTLNYHSYKCQSEEMDLIDYIVYARLVEFEDKEALEKRRGLQHHQDVLRYIKEEDLLRKPLRYVKLQPHSGFDR